MAFKVLSQRQVTKGMSPSTVQAPSSQIFPMQIETDVDRTVSRDGKRPWEVLIVEDNRGDSELLRAALGEWQNKVRVTVVEDGNQALTYVRREGPYRTMARPDLVLLDLNLPGKDGIEVLKEMKSDPRLRSIPVVMITTSDSRSDVARAYGSHANSYMTKSMDVHSFFAKIRSLEEFWFGSVKLPSDEDSA